MLEYISGNAVTFLHLLLLCNECQLCLFPGESNIIWKESNRIITAGKIIIRKDSRLHLENGYNLRIDDLKESDTGEYVCEIETFGSPIHQTSQLEILGNKQMQVFPSSSHPF